MSKPTTAPLKAAVGDPKAGPLTEHHHAHECRHVDDMDWEMLRYPGQ